MHHRNAHAEGLFWCLWYRRNSLGHLMKKPLKICGLFSIVATSSSFTRGNFASYLWPQEGPSFGTAMLSPSVSAADHEGVDATLRQKPTPGLANSRVRASIHAPVRQPVRLHFPIQQTGEIENG
jgi:hypothetical protein